jgi:dTMP kinase
LDAGEIVICDRYMDATLAYQGGARGLGLEMIRALHDLVLPSLVPDLTLLFDLEPRIGLARAWAALEDGQRLRRESRFEAETLAFHEKVRANYLALARQERGRFVILDAAASPEDVLQQMLEALQSRLPMLSGKPPV